MRQGILLPSVTSLGKNFLSNFQSAGLINQHFKMLVFLKGACQQPIES